MNEQEIVAKLERLKWLVDDLLSEQDDADTMKETIEELRELGVIVKQLETELMTRVLARD